MRVILKSQVQGNYKAVMKAFDKQLFEALKPSQGEMEIVAFTGSKTGDKVHLKFVSPIKANWVSAITEDGINNEQAWFVDEGVELPWPLNYWKHRHVVQKINPNQSLIIDDMTFKGKNRLLSLLLYPMIYIGFYPRKKIYKKYFEQLNL